MAQQKNQPSQQGQNVQGPAKTTNGPAEANPTTVGNITTEPDTFEDSEEGDCAESIAPLRAIAMALATAAEGGAMAPVRAVIQKVLPADREGRVTFLAQMQRMSLAAQQAVNVTQEMVA